MLPMSSFSTSRFKSLLPSKSFRESIFSPAFLSPVLVDAFVKPPVVVFTRNHTDIPCGMYLCSYRDAIRFFEVNHFFENETVTMQGSHFFYECLFGEEEEISELVAHLFHVAAFRKTQQQMGQFVTCSETQSFYCSL